MMWKYSIETKNSEDKGFIHDLATRENVLSAISTGEFMGNTVMKIEVFFTLFTIDDGRYHSDTITRGEGEEFPLTNIYAERKLTLLEVETCIQAFRIEALADAENYLDTYFMAL